MSPIRQLEPRDIPAIADMHWRIFSHREGTAPEAVATYFTDMFLRHPWTSPHPTSLVHANGEGGIDGFLGLIPRPMSMDGKPLWAACTTQLMVSPTAPPLTGIKLLRQCFLSGYDLVIADEANDQGRRAWEVAGGSTALLYGLRWTRILRPCRFALSLPGACASIRPLVWCAGGADRIAAFLLPGRRDANLTLKEEDLETDTFLECVRSFTKGRMIKPNYDADTLGWLMGQLRDKHGHGSLRGVALRTDAGAMAGCYLYYVKPETTAQVVLLTAAEPWVPALFTHLFEDARRHGAIAVSGRLDPAYLSQVSDGLCVINRGYGWSLIYSSRPDVLRAFHEGKAFLSRMDGEWWLRFQEVGEPITPR